MKAALLQMTSGTDPAENAATVTGAVRMAAEQGAAMLFTPEMSNLLDRDRDRAARSIVAEEDEPVLAAVRDAAAKSAIWVNLGSLAVRRPDGAYANRGYVIDPTGTIKARYDKLHLFACDLPSGEHWREAAAYAPGDSACVVETPLGRLGLSICYDLRFPDLYRALTDAGATLLSVPAAFTRPTGAAHWEILLRARAIEAGVFVVAAAQTGLHADGRTTYGHSLAVDPWGTVLLDMGEAIGVRVFDLDHARLADARSRIAAVDHRRAIPPVAVA